MRPRAFEVHRRARERDGKRFDQRAMTAITGSATPAEPGRPSSMDRRRKDGSRCSVSVRTQALSRSPRRPSRALDPASMKLAATPAQPRPCARDRADGAAAGQLLPDQEHDLRRADRGDRSVGAVQARSRQRARGNPRHRPRDRLDQESRDVDRRAGGPARRHLQRRARLRPARAAARARRHRRHHGQRPDAHASSKSAARSSSPTSASATTRN